MGPGSPGFSYVAADLIEQIEQPIWGWFSQVDQFAMGPDYVPRPDIGRLLVGTPGIIGLTAARSGIELSAEAGIAAIAAKAPGDHHLRARPLRGARTRVTQPDRSNAARRALLGETPDAASITRVLAADHGVIADFREPDLIRLGCSPLTTRFTDVDNGTRAIARLIAP